MIHPSTATVLAVLVALPSAAQAPHPPQTKIQRGLASLSQGSWGHALAEWNQDGTLTDERLDEVRAALDRLAPQPRTIGEWGALHAPVIQRLWQRHWLMATFDRGAVFLSLDFIWHKGEWRLLKVVPAQDPRELLPHLDEAVAGRERN